jgi:hypothetical protein
MTTTRVPRPYLGAEQRVPKGVRGGPWVADLPQDEAVLFVIGMRVNRWRRIRSWFPVFTAMPAMLRELQKHPEEGLLYARTFWSGRLFVVLQHWRSAEDLGRYARDAERRHAPAWARFNTSGTAGSGDVGIFHETFVVPRDGIETRYANMAPFGLAAAYGDQPRVTVNRRTKADERIGVTEPEYVEAPS